MGEHGLASAELYDPATNTWTAAAPMPGPRIKHTATLLPSGRVLVTGGNTVAGSNSATASTTVYDPVTDSWAPAASMGQPRARHVSVQLANGRVLVLGGGRPQPELYDPASNAWTTAMTGPVPDGGYTATLLANDRVMVAGGFSYGAVTMTVTRSAETYNANIDTWSALPPMPSPRASQTSTPLPGGRVLLAGGYDGTPTDPTVIFDPKAGRWLRAASMHTARGGHTATALGDGSVLVAGGYALREGGVYPDLVSDAEIYRPR
jgi:N-acetylneuraminic acid mutarotase